MSNSYEPSSATAEHAATQDTQRRSPRHYGHVVACNATARTALARILDQWEQDFPDPYLGHHSPKTD